MSCVRLTSQHNHGVDYMPKKNVADSDFDGEILGFNNVEMTQEEAQKTSEWFADQVRMMNEADPENEVKPVIEMLGELIETCFNLGSAHTDDTKEKTVIVIAADYAASDEVDPAEDAVEDKTEEAAS